MRINNQLSQNNEPVTACVYDEDQLGVWLLFTKDEPEFVANVDKHAYQKILSYMASCSSLRHNIYRYFDTLRTQPW